MKNSTPLPQIVDLNLADLKQFGKIIFTDNANQLSVLQAFCKNSIRHLVQRSNVASDNELVFSKLCETEPELFFEFPIASILGHSTPLANLQKDSRVFEQKLTSYSEKEQAFAEINRIISDFNQSKSLTLDILSSLDESVMNAFFNLASSRREISELSTIKVPRGQEIQVFLGFNEERIIVGCMDTFGRLSIDNLLNRVRECYENTNDPILRAGTGTAGIGTFLSFNSCSSMYLGVKKNICTIVCTSYPYKISAKKRFDLPKNLHAVSI